jgi:Holliday junction resolvase RusA-like endonuclease
MTDQLRINVYGTPESQGSMNAYVRGGKAVVTSDNSKLRPWRDAVTWAARDAMANTPSWTYATGPVRVDTKLWLPRPLSRPKTTDVLPITGKDVDKMLRSVFDSLTNAGVWLDDVLVCSGTFDKRYAVGPHLPKIYRPDFHWPQPGVSMLITKLPLDGT